MIETVVNIRSVSTSIIFSDSFLASSSCSRLVRFSGGPTSSVEGVLALRLGSEPFSLESCSGTLDGVVLKFSANRLCFPLGVASSEQT